MVMLGLTRRATKILKTLNKQLGAVVWQAVANKPIWVFLATAVISAPCLAETPAVEGAKVAPELVSSGKMIGKGLNQSSMKRMTAKTGESGRIDSGAESGGGGNQASTALTPNSKSVAKPLSEPVTTPSYYSKEQKTINPALGLAQRISDSEQWFWLLCFAAVALAPIFTTTKTPNVEHNRRTAASSSGVRVDGPVGPQR